jgi:hypothetical protein
MWRLPASSAGAWITATSLGLVWAYLVRFCAVALQSVQSGYARIPASLDDSARMLGVTGWGLMRRVHAPLLQRTTIAAALLVFVDVMKELPATMVLRPFNSDTLAVVAYQLARDERLGEAALPSLALVLVGLIPVILLSRTLRQRTWSCFLLWYPLWHPLWASTPWAIGVPWRYARNRPQGWAPTNSPWALCLRRSPPCGRWVCLGGAHAIAHRGGLLQKPPRAISPRSPQTDSQRLGLI